MKSAIHIIKFRVHFEKIYCRLFYRVSSLGFFFSLFFSNQVNGQLPGKGFPIITNYLPKEYSSEVRNYAIAQDAKGHIWVGNENKILRFDGNTWDHVEIPNQSRVRTLHTDEKGNLWVGAQGTFGKVNDNNLGKIEFIDLTSTLPEKERAFTNIWSIHTLNDTTFIHTVSKFIEIYGNHITIKHTSNTYHKSFMVNKKIYLREEGVGLMVRGKDGFSLVNGGDYFASTIISYLEFIPDQGLIIGTRDKGILVLTNDGKIIPWKNKAQKLLIRDEIYTGLRLQSGRLAIGTLKGGIYILDSTGELDLILNEKSGLNSNGVHALFQDSYHNLWAALTNGLAMVEISTPITIWNKYQGLKGTVYSNIWHNDKLYAGTDEGLFELDWNEKRFKNVQGVGAPCWRIIEYQYQNEKSLIALTSFGIYEIKNNKVKLIDPGRSHAFDRNRNHNNWVFIGQEEQVLAMKKSQFGWEKVQFPIANENWIWETTFDNEGNLWLTTDVKGLIRIDLNNINQALSSGVVSESITYKKYTERHGLPNLVKSYIELIDTTLWIGTTSGMLFYDKSVDRILPYHPVNGLFQDDIHFYSFSQDQEGNVWFDSNYGKGKLTLVDGKWQLGEYELRRIPMAGEGLTRLGKILPENNGIVWYPTPMGLIRYNTEREFIDYHTHTAHLRVSRINGLPISVQSTGKFTHNIAQLKFQFSTNYLLYPEGHGYKYFLKGYDTSWSDWTNENIKEYTQLPPGKYSMQVIGKNVFGIESTPAIWEFEVIPLWYETWLGKLFFVSLGIIFLWGLMYLNNKRIKRYNEKLEEIIKKRTKEITVQKERAIAVSKENQRKAAFQQLLAIISSDFIKVNNQNLDSKIDDMLKATGEFFQADRTYIFQLDQENNLMTNTHEWCAHNISSEKNNLQGIDIKPFQWMLEEGLAKENFIIHNVDKIPDEFAIAREELKRQKIKSLLMIPISYHEKRPVAMLGFDFIRENKRWEKDKLSLLKVVSNIVADALTKSRLEKEMLEAKIKAEESDRFKTSILTNISHEIRTPMNAIVGFSELLTLRSLDEQKREKYAKLIRQGGQDLLAIVNDILDLSKIQHGDSALIPINGNLQALLDNLFLYYATIEEEQKEKIEVRYYNELKGEENYLIADYTKLNQVLINLLNNARKFTTQGRIEFGCKKKQDYLLFYVKDTGIGIPEDKLEFIFEPFRQVVDPTKASKGGTGLGLAICKGFVELWNGEIWAESLPGTGATFWFTLPYQRWQKETSE